MGIKVEAKEKGFYDGEIRNEGDEFEINGTKSFSKKWMKKTGKGSTSEAPEVEAQPPKQ